MSAASLTLGEADYARMNPLGISRCPGNSRGMTSARDMIVLEPLALKLGGGWYVKATHPNGRIEEVTGFAMRLKPKIGLIGCLRIGSEIGATRMNDRRNPPRGRPISEPRLSSRFCRCSAKIRVVPIIVV
jgi:hypothetical protein